MKKWNIFRFRKRERNDYDPRYGYSYPPQNNNYDWEYFILGVIIITIICSIVSCIINGLSFMSIVKGVVIGVDIALGILLYAALVLGLIYISYKLIPIVRRIREDIKQTWFLVTIVIAAILIVYRIFLLCVDPQVYTLDDDGWYYHHTNKCPKIEKEWLANNEETDTKKIELTETNLLTVQLFTDRSCCPQCMNWHAIVRHRIATTVLFLFLVLTPIFVYLYREKHGLITEEK